MAAELTSPNLSDALVILGAAGIVIPLFARFRITPIIGFILVGVAVGPFGLGRLVPQYPWLAHVTIGDAASLEPFAQFGIILLLFSIGLELSCGRLWQMRRLVFGLGALELVVIAALFALILLANSQPVAGSIALGLALAMSSTTLVLRITGSRTPVGRAALAMLLFEDIALVPIIFLLGALAPAAAGGGLDGLMRTLWLGIVVIAMLLVIGRLLLPRLFAQAARTKSPELFLSVSLLAVIAAALATAAVGLSPIVGALIAGLLIAETEYHGAVEHITEPFRGLALGIFLLTIGMRIDLLAIWANLGQILATTAGVLAMKAVVTGALLRLMGARAGTATETGILMSSPSETTLIVLSAAASAGLLDRESEQFWQIVTAIGLTVTPALAWIGRRLGNQVDRAAPMPPLDGPDRERVIIVGFGRVGRLVADMLTAHGKRYVAIDSDAEIIAEARRAGYSAIFGEAVDRQRPLLGPLGSEIVRHQTGFTR